MDRIVERIERDAGLPGLVELLAGRLEPTDLQSLLLEVYRRRGARRSPAAVLADYLSNRFVRPAAVSPQRLCAWDQIAFEQLPPGFNTVELAPLCPLGTCASVAPVDPRWSVATVRNSELVSDTTNVLALECAVERRELLRARRPSQWVHLAASQRVVRAQHYDRPELLAHFELLALCSAGRDATGQPFEPTALVLHALFYLRALRAFLGPGVVLRLEVSDLSSAPRPEALEALLAAVRRDVAGVECRVDLERSSGRGYYSGFCFHIYATPHEGHPMELVDGGAVDWVSKLLSDAKEHTVISGIGSERVCGAVADLTGS